MTGGQVQGFVDPRFSAVRDVFTSSVASGADLGAAVAITVDGETVVDLWGGWSDEARTTPWQHDTVVNVFSVSKTLTALVALVLADSGELDLFRPVAAYWPDFAAAGKADVTTSQLLSHSAGLSGWAEKLEPRDLYDWERCTSLLAAQAPFWKPGTAPGYHGMTQGYLVGEVVRRITGSSLGTVLRDLVAHPLKADLHLGFDEDVDARVAEMVIGDVVPPSSAPTELAINMLTNPAGDPLAVNTREWRAAEIPAANVHANARAVAETHRVLANAGTANGVQLLSEQGCRAVLGTPVEGVDVVLGLDIRYGHGFGVTGAQLHAPNPNTVYWPGVGGALTILDLDARTTFAYTPNRMFLGALLDPRALDLATAMWNSL